MEVPYFYNVGDTMPKYGRFKYGRIAKYGRYNMGTGSDQAIGPYVRYKMRTRGEEAYPFVVMNQERIEVPAKTLIDSFRVRANGGEWVYTQTDSVIGETQKVRIRSLESDGGVSPWVEGVKGNLKLI
jgi:hypothetical protein